ncbi:hypothetical protein Clacol_006620 [Clathrus columnatus]|uniref:Uncharacterized protein n=1 Tax=Clathrus columnatus TaxID=1419009 RepID=A0AAV5AGT6_9AGAM|nr:hypothetical protein Clacol_006620 [Clathrus columnatus]
MVRAATSTSASLGGLFGDGSSDLTDLTDTEEVSASISRERTGSPVASGSSIPWTSSTNSRSRKTITYKSKRKLSTEMPVPSVVSAPVAVERCRPASKQAQRDSAPSTPPNAKRRKLNQTPPSTSQSLKSLVLQPPSISTLRISSSFIDPSKKLDDIFSEKDVVWIKVSLHGEEVQPDEEKGGSFYWWPAQVLEDDLSETTIELFGNPGYDIPRRIKLPPFSSRTVSFRLDNQLRYKESSFFEEFSSEGAVMLPDLTTRWNAAVAQALEAEREELLPDASSLINDIVPTKQPRNGKEKEPYLPCTSSQSCTEKSPIKPPDESVRVGEDGELVLASDHRGRPDHWPARVVSRSLDQKNRRWLYEVCYIDGKRKKLERSRFFTCMEPGFATCQMGQWETIRPPSEDSSDDEDETHDNNPQEFSHALSPSPSNPDLEDIQDADEFFDRSLPNQMKYVHPILCRVIRREYPPAYISHDDFIKGGKARQELVRSAANYGQFSENEIQKITNLIRKVMLRDERWAKRVIEDEEDQQPGEILSMIEEKPESKDKMTDSERYSGKPRPKGCEAYENLSRADRGLYCTDVLLPVAIVQLHLLRSGERKSWKVQSEEQEKALYSKGLELMVVTHKNTFQWVSELVTMRRMAENLQKKKMRKTTVATNHAKRENDGTTAIASTPPARSRRRQVQV